MYNRTYGPANLTVTGGAGLYMWSVSGISGITVDASSGALGGAPTSVGSQTLLVTVTDSAGATATASFPVTITYPPLSIITSVPNGMVNQVYGPVTLGASGGSGGSYPWSGGGIPGLTVTSGGVISGTPTTAGPFTLSVTVNDATAKLTTSLSYSITIAAGPLTITTTSLPNGTALIPYGPFGLAAMGGTGTYTWSGSGTPSGVAVSSSGFVGGTPSDSGTFTITATVTDQAGKTASATYTINIALATLTLSGSGALGGFLPGAAVSGGFGVTGGRPPYTWSSSGLPSSLSLNSTGGIFGTAPAGGGNYSFTVTVTDSQTPTPGSASSSGSLSVLGFSTSALPSGTTATAYSAGVSAVGGTPPYSFTSTGVPSGLSLDSSGFISGTPASSGTFTVPVTVTDSAGLSLSTSFSITIGTGLQPLQLSGGTLPDGALQTGYSQTLQANGGKPPYTWSLLAGVLPAGLSLADGGTIAGTPTAIGSWSFTARATDSSGGFISATYTIGVNPLALKLTSSLLPDGIATAGYPTQTLGATGGIPPYTFALTAGSLPAGLTFDNGQISGMPTTAETTGFTVTVTDSANVTASGSFSVGIEPSHADLVLAQGSVGFALSTGATAVPASASVPVRSSFTDQILNYTVSPDSSAPWLTVGGGGSTPDPISIGLNSQALSLAPNTYSATVTVACVAPSPCAGSMQTIVVSLAVTAPAPQLTLGTILLSFSSTTASPQPMSQPLTIANTGGGVINISSVTAADPWVTITGVPASIAAGVSVPVSINVNPMGLAANYYETTITVTSSAGSATAQVALLVSANPSMSLSPGGVQLLSTTGSAPGNTTGSFLVSVSGGSAVQWTSAILPGNNTSWLTLQTTSGSSTSSAPGMISYSIDPAKSAALAAGTYYATIRVTSTDVVDSPLDYQVVLNVAPAATLATPDPEPAGLVFISSGSTALPPQTVQVFASSPTPVLYQASAAPDSPWLSVSPATGMTSSGSPGQSTISVNTSKLAPGTYRGGVSYGITSAASRTVNVTLIVEAPGGAAAGSSEHLSTSAISPAQSAGGCAPSQIVPTQTGLTSNFAQPTSWPTPLTIKLTDDCGSAIPNGQVVTTFTNGDPPLVLQAIDSASGLYSGTWTPRATAPQVTITARATATGFPAASITLLGQVTRNAAPVLAANGTVNIFVPVTGSPLAPGTIVQIYGSNMAAAATSFSTVPLTTSLGNTQVLIGGIPAPLYYVSSGQINAQVPFELAPGKPYQIIINANGALSTPNSVQVGADSPGIAAFAGGQIIAQHVDGSIVTDASPAKPGEYIVFYVAGMGLTTGTVTSGTLSPSNPPAMTLDTPTLTLNGVNVPIYFAGLSPGFVGLYQVNFQVPTNTPNGDLQLVLIQSGGQSNVTVLAVHN